MKEPFDLFIETVQFSILNNNGSNQIDNRRDII
jgi:hypothetical protein